MIRFSIHLLKLSNLCHSISTAISDVEICETLLAMKSPTSSLEDQQNRLRRDTFEDPLGACLYVPLRILSAAICG
jgi:hypothetical protein